MGQLTSLANYKRYMGLTTTVTDAALSRLIVAESAVIESYLGRSFGYVTQAHKRVDGHGTSSIVLHDQPIVTVTQVNVCGANLPLSDDGMKYGYVFDDTAIFFIGDKFPRGKQNVAVSWEAGYRATETANIPTGNAPTIEPIAFGYAQTDRGVIFTANSVALVAITSGANLTTGQYAFADGVYSFAVIDAGKTVAMTFDYVPSAVQQAAIEMVALDMVQRGNIGISSKTLAGESISYVQNGISSSAKEMLAPYRRWAPS